MLTLNTFHVSEHFFKSAKSLTIYMFISIQYIDHSYTFINMPCIIEMRHLWPKLSHICLDLQVTISC